MRRLDPTKLSPEMLDLKEELLKKVVGQDRAIREIVKVANMIAAGMTPKGRPRCNFLFLGPTGSGKTRMVEALAEYLYGKSDAVLKIDCAEFQHSHEISKLIGSPPGYLGHRETHPLITQEALEKHFTETRKAALVLFDEIEKSSDALWNLLLGILDKATLTLGDNQKVDFSRAMIFMTSNLGSSEMMTLLDGGMGFLGVRGSDENLDQQIYKVATGAAVRRFSPEFMNRVDRSIVFRKLTEDHLRQILDIELNRVQERLNSCENSPALSYTDEAKAFLLAEGRDDKYGARHVKRSLDRHIVQPVAAMMASREIESLDQVRVSIENGKPVFDVVGSLLLHSTAESAVAAEGGA